MYRRISIVSHPQHTQCNSFLIIHFAVFMTQFRNMTLDHTAREQKCSSCRKLLLFYHCSSCYCFRDTRGIVFVVCCIVLSKGCKPFMWDLTRAATSPTCGVKLNLLGFTELLVLLRFGTFLFEMRAICGVTSGQRSMEWSAFPFF